MHRLNTGKMHQGQSSRQAKAAAHRAIIVGVQILKGLHQSAAHVPCLSSLDCRVHQALAPSHGVEEELRGAEA